MNPQEFSWTEEQQVTVTNPTSETYKFKVHGKEYQIGAGKVAKMPGYIAWAFAYGLGTQLAQADGLFNRWNEEGFRQIYYEKVTVGVDEIIQVVTQEPEPEVHVFDEQNSDTQPEPQPSPAPAVPDEQPEPEAPADKPAPADNSRVKPMTAKAKVAADEHTAKV